MSSTLKEGKRKDQVWGKMMNSATGLLGVRSLWDIQVVTLLANGNMGLDPN